MARKRVISPEIWESCSFSELSDLAKIVFISLISHADDEGRGRADTSLIKNITFPYDGSRRVADVEFALSEIARSTSTQFYKVNGIAYYWITSWKKWQKIDKPSKSKLPPPSSMGEGGAILFPEKFDEGSTNARRGFDECSTTNRIEQNRIENITHTNAHTRKFDEDSTNVRRIENSNEISGFERSLKEFCSLWNVTIDNYSSDIANLDFERLSSAYDRSKKFLQTVPCAKAMSWIVKNANSIYAGKYEDKQESVEPNGEGFWDSMLNNVGRIE